MRPTFFFEIPGETLGIFLSQLNPRILICPEQKSLILRPARSARRRFHLHGKPNGTAGVARHCQ